VLNVSTLETWVDSSYASRSYTRKHKYTHFAGRYKELIYLDDLENWDEIRYSTVRIDRELRYWLGGSLLPIISDHEQVSLCVCGGV
jgi:hypothetical protein